MKKIVVAGVIGIVIGVLLSDRIVIEYVDRNGGWTTYGS